jgi:hypothetical protein
MYVSPTTARFPWASKLSKDVCAVILRIPVISVVPWRTVDAFVIRVLRNVDAACRFPEVVTLLRDVVPCAIKGPTATRVLRVLTGPIAVKFPVVLRVEIVARVVTFREPLLTVKIPLIVIFVCELVVPRDVWPVTIKSPPILTEPVVDRRPWTMVDGRDAEPDTVSVLTAVVASVVIP